MVINVSLSLPLLYKNTFLPNKQITLCGKLYDIDRQSKWNKTFYMLSDCLACTVYAVH